MQKKIPAIFDITKFTALDFPGHLAAIIWFAKCNMRCQYCYNKHIVFGQGKIEEYEAIDFLKSRIGLLDGVVLSGGEATLYQNLKNFCIQIKKLGFKIKLDTNGLKPDVVKSLVKSNLIDYIALDYKAPRKKFYSITKNNNFHNFNETLNFLIKSNFDFEVRSTIHSDLLDENDINKIINDLYQKNHKGTYYIQNFLDTNKNIGNIPAQTRQLNTNHISTKINTQYR